MIASTTRGILTILIASLALLSACAPTPTPSGDLICPEDTQTCPDGSTVSRVLPTCEFAACPSVPVSGSTFREYKSQSPDTCAVMRFSCGDDAEYFGDDTGCGCVRQHTNPAVTLCSTDVEPVCGWYGPNIQCFAYPCAQTYTNICMAALNADVASTTPGECPAVGGDTAPPKLQAIECPAERTQACTREYRPVCGQAVLNTGEVSSQTYGNACSACAEMKVVSYTEGECGATDGSARGPIGAMPVKKPATDCTDPRPEICTLEYNPVCGQKDDGTAQTFGNKCSACADSAVLSYVSDACASDFATYTFQPKQCEATPWQTWYQDDGAQFAKAPTDEELITAYYGEKGIDASAITKIDSGMVTCEACSVCATSYRFSLRVSRDSDTAILTADGWTLKIQNY